MAAQSCRPSEDSIRFGRKEIDLASMKCPASWRPSPVWNAQPLKARITGAPHAFRPPFSRDPAEARCGGVGRPVTFSDQDHAAATAHGLDDEIPVFMERRNPGKYGGSLQALDWGDDVA